MFFLITSVLNAYIMWINTAKIVALQFNYLITNIQYYIIYFKCSIVHSLFYYNFTFDLSKDWSSCSRIEIVGMGYLLANAIEGLHTSLDLYLFIHLAITFNSMVFM